MKSVLSLNGLPDGVLLASGLFRHVGSGRIISSVRSTLERLQPHLPEDKRAQGVYVCVIMRGTDVPYVPVIHCLVGPIVPEKMERYCAFSKEKVVRMLQNPGHVLSWQSRDDALEHYQGAALGYYHGIGVSGLPSDADEVIAIEALIAAGNIDRYGAGLMASYSGNQYYPILNPASA